MKPVAAIVALLAAACLLFSQTAPRYPDARATNPNSLGWMQGAPPPPNKLIRWEDESFFRFPQIRWTLSHWREIFPTLNISRGAGPASALPLAERADLDAVTFTPLNASQPMTWKQSLDANYTDGIVVLHRGSIVYERYFGALQPDRHHIAFSVTKSFIGALAATLVSEGKIDPTAPISDYLPELSNSGFADATVAQVLDMTTGLKYIEAYDDPTSDWHDYKLATLFFPRPAGYSGPQNAYEYLATVRKLGEHGPAFKYRSINTDVLGWIMTRVTGKSPAELIAERIWAPMGAEDDASLGVGPSAIQSVAGGLNCRLRDLARFGELIRLNGRFNGKQIFPATVIAEIHKGGSPAAFATAGYKTLPGWSYHNQWWISHNDHAAIAARGIHGQGIYIDPNAEMVIARFASHPQAGNVNLDPTTVPAYEAIARRLMAKPR